ncbi:hypothetical protein P692DRAFT_20779090 [Suillus brevipes Sb2]|nr:hypothetical protein P692DRAFT_20779090 [Suillus brevipes Sb2]
MVAMLSLAPFHPTVAIYTTLALTPTHSLTAARTATPQLIMSFTLAATLISPCPGTTSHIPRNLVSQIEGRYFIMPGAVILWIDGFLILIFL